MRRFDPDAVRTWALVAAVVLYLAVDGGGDLVVSSQVAIVVWWIVLEGAAWGLLPAGEVVPCGVGSRGDLSRLCRVDRARVDLVAEL